MNFPEKLQKLRKERGWSQEELANRITVSRQAVSKWELGTAVPDTDNIVQLSELFGVTTDYLIKDGQRRGHPRSSPHRRKGQKRGAEPSAAHRGHNHSRARNHNRRRTADFIAGH